jgi:hypothetical protein
MDLHQALNDARSAVQTDPEHKLAPEHRRAIYAALEPAIPLTQLPQVMKKRGKLAVSAARYVVSIWDQLLPIDDESTEEQYRIDHLPHKLLRLADEVLGGTADIHTIWETANEEWYIVGNVGEEFFEFRDYDHDAEAHSFHNAYFVVTAALHALLETLGTEFLTGRTQTLGRVDMATGNLSPTPPGEEEIPDNELDAAGAAAIAFAGYDHPDPQKQLIFWEWWLNEAIPTVTQGEA